MLKHIQTFYKDKSLRNGWGQFKLYFVPDFSYKTRAEIETGGKYLALEIEEKTCSVLKNSDLF